MHILLASLPYFDNRFHVQKEMQSGIGYKLFRSGNLNNKKKIYPICDLLYAASLLRKNNFSVSIDDDQFRESLEFNSYFLDLSKKNKVPDIVFIRTSLPTIKSDVDVLIQLKKKWKKTKFIVFGPVFASNDILEFIKQKKIYDGIITSEIESVILKIVKNEKNIPGFYFKKNKKYFIQNKEVTYTEMDKLPPPAYDLVDYKKIEKLIIQTQRGCPVGCAYCPYYLSQKNKFRAKRPETVIKELIYLKKRFNIKRIVIHDPILSLDKKRLTAICNRIIEESLDIEWECETHLAHIDSELLLLMRKAGCVLTAFGVESANEKVLTNVNRRFKKWDVAKQIITLCKKIGISTRGYFILGLPEDNIKGSFATIKLAKFLGLDFASFNLPIPIPGTLPYNQGLDMGVLDKNEKINKPDLFFDKISIHHDGNDISLSKNISQKQLKYIFRVANHYTTLFKTKGLIQKMIKFLKISIYVIFILFNEILKKLKI
tara:strand:+ start:2337 stop:3794 length:1458 start_codon:yes stop_codon:yes gene_type:complete